jgi:hypothetical protein
MGVNKNIKTRSFPSPDFSGFGFVGKILKLCNFSFEGYAGGARIENVCVKVHGVMKSLSMETLEIMESFEKV